MSGRMTSTTVYLRQEQLAALRAASRETRIPMAELVRRGIDLALLEVEGILEAQAAGCVRIDEEGRVRR